MDDPECERDNLAQIAALNQRGGHTLSIVDLIQDGTITAEMAALCWLVVERGASFITGAVPGGAGKTTLMGALLAFLPPGERLVTVEEPAVIREALAGRLCPPAALLAHEIGPGYWLGYIWGEDAADFFRAWRQGLRCVSCLHADTSAQASDALHRLGVTDMDMEKVALRLFMRVEAGPRRMLRRVSTVDCVLGGRLRTLYRWQPQGDRFEPCLGPPELCGLLAAQYGGSQDDVENRWGACARCLEGLRREGTHALADVRRRIMTAG